MTEGFGRKWKDSFHTLEDRHGLDALDPSHIWLLHQLFLPAINRDALAWAEVWNSHKIQLEGERRSSPQQLFTRSSLTDGICGLPPQDRDLEDYGSYGIDWEAMDDLRFAGGTGDDAEPEGGYNQPEWPEWTNNVVCEPPNCPLDDEQAEELLGEFSAVRDAESMDMERRRVV